MTSVSPSSSSRLPQKCFSSATSSSSKRWRGNATLLYSSVSAMRPTRSCCFTSRYLLLMSSRVVSLGAG